MVKQNQDEIAKLITEQKAPIKGNATEKIAPTLADSVFSGQLNSEVGQPHLLKTMLDVCKLKDQVNR